MMENGKLAALISFVVGIAIGANWGKIKKFFPKAQKGVMKFAEEARETIEDTTKKIFHQKPHKVKEAEA